MKNEKYKVCLLGNSLAGWAAAALLQAKGYPVAVLEPVHEPSEHDASEFLTGFMLKPLLKRVGYHPSQLTHITTLDVPFQWIDSRKRLSWFTDDERFKSELEREFPEASENMHELFSHDPEAINVYRHLLNSRVHLPPRSFFPRRHFFKVLQAVVKTEHLESIPAKNWYDETKLNAESEELLSICQLGLTSLESPVSTRAQMAHFLYSLRWEGHTTQGGLRKIKTMLKDKFISLGGQHFMYEQILDLNWSGAHLHGVRYKKNDVEGSLTFDNVIIGGDPFALIQIDPKHRVLSKWKKEIQDSCSRIGVRATKNYVIPTELIPVGFRSQGMFFWNADKKPNKEQRKFPRIVRFVLSALDDTRSNLALSYFVNPEGLTPRSEILNFEVEEILGDIFPFFDVENHRSEPWVIPHVEGKKGHFAEPYVYYIDQKSGPWLESMPVACPIKNGLYAGKMVLAGLGLDGEILTGMHISNELASA